MVGFHNQVSWLWFAGGGGGRSFVILMGFGLKGFSISLGTTTNNIVELEVVRFGFGLDLTWNMGFKHINFQINFTLVM